MNDLPTWLLPAWILGLPLILAVADWARTPKQMASPGERRSGWPAATVER